MRIVIPAPESSDSFQDNVAHTLRRMGHQVITFPGASSPIPLRWRRTYREARRRLGTGYISPEEQWLVRVTSQEHPDVLLALTQQIHEEVLRAIKGLGIRARVAWWGDPPANMWRWGLLSPEWDLVYLKDRAAVEKFRRVGVRAEVLHEAMNPDWHKPLSEQVNDEVVVAGTWYAYRQVLVSRLLESGVKVGLYGPGVPPWGLEDLKRRHTRRFIIKEEKSRVFGAGLAVLNSTCLEEGDSLNCRAFEVAGACALQIMENRSSIAECFEPGREVLVFDSFDEILEHLEMARVDPIRAKAIRLAGFRRAIAEHTYVHRLNRILSAVTDL